MLAAGEGRRVGHDTNKVLLPLAGRRVFTWAIRWARHLPHVVHTVLVIREQDRPTIEASLAREVGPPEVTVVVGGETRHGSEWNALQALAPLINSDQVDVVVIHDAARPLASTALFGDVIDAAWSEGGAIPAIPMRGLITLDHEAPVQDHGVAAVQTPQAFVAAPLLAAYTQADRDGFIGTDTASCIEEYAEVSIKAVPTDARNIKITFPEDLFLAERLLAQADYDLTGDASATAHRRPHLRELLRRGEK